MSFLFAILGNRLWLACLLLAPFAALVPLETYYICRYLHPSTEEALATIFATNSNETLEYFGRSLLPLAGCMLAGLLLAVVAAWYVHKADLRWQHWSRRWIVLGATALPTVLFVLGMVGPRPVGATPVHSGMGAMQMLAVPLANSYPFGVISRIITYQRQWSEMVDSVGLTKNFHFNASQHEAADQRQIYVLVVGESSSRARWQLFGQPRETTPRLHQVENLVKITDMLSSWPASVVAIPIVLTRKPIGKRSLAWNESSIVRAMREAGYETWWISNQLPLGEHDSPISAYAVEAEHLLFLNRAIGDARDSYDEVLVQPLRDAIDKSTKDLFVVLHMMGSHQDYDARYPVSFRRFRPVYSEADTDEVSGETLINSYDNTVVYTDYILSQVIYILRGSNAITALWYVSDHGETLPTPVCPLAGHGVDTRAEFEIPALFWYSDLYAKDFPERVETLRSNADKPTLTANTFESLIDMAGVAFPGHDETWSMFSPQWTFHPRIVNPMHAAQIDFDHAAFDDKCSIPISPEVKAGLR